MEFFDVCAVHFIARVQVGGVKGQHIIEGYAMDVGNGFIDEKDAVVKRKNSKSKKV